MPAQAVENLGRRSLNLVASFGVFCDFVGRTLAWLFTGGLQMRHLRNLWDQCYEVGARSVPVVAVVGTFLGMVMAVDTYSEFKAFEQESRIGELIFLSVCKEVGPVLAAVMLAGRVGGALTAELGTMNVTEQLDALRVMGADPIRHLVVPRFMACMLLTPVLTLYSDAMGMAGGWLIAVRVMGVPSGPFWHYAQSGMDMWQINEGLIKSFFFGGAIGLISCYKGFHCGAGASGVGRACTDSFVVSFIAIIVMNLIASTVSHEWLVALYGSGSLLAG